MNQEYGPAFTPIDKPGKNLSSLLSYKNKYNRPNSELGRSIRASKTLQDTEKFKVHGSSTMQKTEIIQAHHTFVEVLNEICEHLD